MAEHPGKEVVQELIDKDIALDERPDGPVIVKLDEKLGLTTKNTASWSCCGRIIRPCMPQKTWLWPK